MRRSWLFVLAVAAIATSGAPRLDDKTGALAAGPVHSLAAAGARQLSGHVSSDVRTGRARMIGPHARDDRLSLGVALALRNRAQLYQFLHDVGDPYSPKYHQFLSQEMANELYNPTTDQEQRGIGWLQGHGLTIQQTFRNHLLLIAEGRTDQVESMLNISINDYEEAVNGRKITFYAPDREPTVDSSVSDIVTSIGGLDDYPHFRAASNGSATGAPPYHPQDLANAYDLNPLWNASPTAYNGTGQRIAIVYWSAPPSEATLSAWSSGTGGASVATCSNGRLYIAMSPGNGTNYCNNRPALPTTDPTEPALDLEAASGMAPGASVSFYVMSDGTGPTSATAPGSTTPAEAALNQAGSDVVDNWQISLSWTYLGAANTRCETSNPSAPFTPDAFEQAAEDIFATNSATGHDYLASSGDEGTLGNCQTQSTSTSASVEFPGSSPFVTSVGGTQFQSNIPTSGGNPGETGWNETSSKRLQFCGLNGDTYSGVCSTGGYSWLFPRPLWQVALNSSMPGTTSGNVQCQTPPCRGVPDVSAMAGGISPSTDHSWVLHLH